ESSITANVVVNEAGSEQPDGGSRSLGVSPATTPPAVAIIGNVLVGPHRLPSRQGVDPAFDNWGLLNTEIDQA
ncbi:MAG TPA: hypothetical protein VHZ03_35305, partial [Trebonia sp.]|nr:hypothetical protein [Trebonia sp.]